MGFAHYEVVQGFVGGCDGVIVDAVVVVAVGIEKTMKEMVSGFASLTTVVFSVDYEEPYHFL